MTDAVGSGYIYIPNWDEFQHYKDRRPVWIKTYTELMDKDEYRDLSLADRGLLHGLWILTAKCGNGKLKADTRSLRSRLGVRKVSLEPLIHAGFIIIVASKTGAQSREETEKEERREEPISKVSHPTSLTFEQQQATDALMATIGDDADEKTIVTVRRRTERLAPNEIWDVREGVRQCLPGNRARYAVDLLMRKTGERAA